MSDERPWLIERHNNTLVEWLRLDERGWPEWILDRDRALHLKSEEAAWVVIEAAGYAGQDRVKPRRLMN
jgi:hypothetical protein